MRDKWYADNRDLVKWGVLLTLAQRHAARHILQVLYFRPSEWAQLELDGEQIPLPDAVIRHFRRAAAASAIEASAPIEILAEPFEDRDEYHRVVIERIRSRSATPGIVFLDPDTGLESGAPSLDHVLGRELSDMWAELKAGDVLLFYQHQTNRNGQPWIAPKKEQFERAIGLPIGAAKVARSVPIARDVAFFYVQKAAG
jgi:hypothetical protein